MRKAHRLSILILTVATGPCFAADLGTASGEGAMSGDIEQTAAADRFKPTYAYAWKENRGAKQQMLIYLFDRKAPAGQWTDAENRESAIVDWMIDNKASVVSWTLDDQGKPDGVQSCGADGSCRTSGNNEMNDVASLVTDIKSDEKENSAAPFRKAARAAATNGVTSLPATRLLRPSRRPPCSTESQAMA